MCLWTRLHESSRAATRCWSSLCFPPEEVYPPASLGGRDGENLVPAEADAPQQRLHGQQVPCPPDMPTAIMAQMGMKVPADSLKMSPVDRIFTRRRPIHSGRTSTFFIELAETAIILKSATQDSVHSRRAGARHCDIRQHRHRPRRGGQLVRRARCRTSCHSLPLSGGRWSVDARVKLGHMQCIVTVGRVSSEPGRGRRRRQGGLPVPRSEAVPRVTGSTSLAWRGSPGVIQLAAGQTDSGSA